MGIEDKFGKSGGLTGLGEVEVENVEVKEGYHVIDGG